MGDDNAKKRKQEHELDLNSVPVLVDDQFGDDFADLYQWLFGGDAKRHRGIPDSPPKPLDPKQKGVVMSHELEYVEGHRIEWMEMGDCSVPLFCAVCTKDDHQLMKLTPCGHCICLKCLAENIVKDLKCPVRNCATKWTPEQFRSRNYVPRELCDRWLNAASEARVLENQGYFVCPVCDAVLMDDERGFLIRACTECWRIFCVICKVPWHMGVACNEYLELTDDLLDCIVF